MASRHPHRSSDNLVNDNITNLLTSVTELQTAVNALLTDYKKHDHGATYAAATLRQNTAVNTVTAGSITAAAATGTVPAFLIDDPNI